MKKVFLGIFLSLVMIIIGGLSTVYYLDYREKHGLGSLAYEMQKQIKHQEETKPEVVEHTVDTPTQDEPTKESYEESIPIEYVKSGLYVTTKSRGGDIWLYRDENSHYELGALGKSNIDSFSSLISGVLNGGASVQNNSLIINKTSSGIDIRFISSPDNGTISLTTRQAEKLLYDLKHPNFR